MTEQPPTHQHHVLRDYALLADGERGALVGPRGDIVWLCVPTWDSPAVFSALIGGASEYTVTPEQPFVWGGSYDGGSMIWVSHWATTSGIVECREALAYPADPHRAVLLRRLRALDQEAALAVTLRPRGDYDQVPMTDVHRSDGIWTARAGSLHLRWTGASAARVRDHRTTLELRVVLAPGEQHDLILEVSDRSLPRQPVDAERTWQASEHAWQEAVPPLTGTLNARDTRRSYAVLRGLTSSGGGMVAAATTSLPERAQAGRNYDYRYVWIRDQCYAGQAVAAASGADPLLDDAIEFVSARLLADGHHLVPAYTVHGDPVPAQRHLRLRGYPGGFDIIGNRVREQFQLDTFGEALLLLAVGARQDRLDTRHWDAARIATSAIAARWNEPDAGIWEIDNRAWTHSRLTAAAGLRAIAAAEQGARGAGIQGAAADRLALADRIVADTAQHALHPDGHWQRAPDDAQLDAALLLPSLRGAIAADDPRTIATFRAYLRELTRDGYAYRFRHDERPLSDAEGSFLLCGFLVALTYHRLGRPVLARSWYDTTRAAAGPPQLFSEEYDATQHQMRGNLPQAFVHALHVETAASLAGGSPE